MKFSATALSSFLTFRYLVEPDMTWDPSLAPPVWPDLSADEQQSVSTTAEILEFLASDMETVDNDTGILLSGGIDSAILASYLPPGAKAYTIRFVAPGAIDETKMARVYAERFDLDLSVVEVTWEDYQTYSQELMLKKRSPMHAIEVALFKASKTAAADGIKTLLVGNGADSTFGGMDKLLSKDWTFDEFVERYTFIDAAGAVADAVSVDSYWEEWRTDGGFDVQGFLKRVHGIGIVQSFEFALHTGGCEVRAPYEQLKLGRELDIERVRSGDTKYLLRDVFRERVPGIEVPEKIPFARPMSVWLADWDGPKRSEFSADLQIEDYSGEQRWLLWCSEVFMNAVEQAS